MKSSPNDRANARSDTPNLSGTLRLIEFAHPTRSAEGSGVYD
jgi:hypothetical protein